MDAILYSIGLFSLVYILNILQSSGGFFVVRDDHETFHDRKKNKHLFWTVYIK